MKPFKLPFDSTEINRMLSDITEVTSQTNWQDLDLGQIIRMQHLGAMYFYRVIGLGGNLCRREIFALQDLGQSWYLLPSSDEYGFGPHLDLIRVIPKTIQA